MSQYQIGIIGDRQTVYAFAALGFAIFEAETAAEAKAALCRAADSGNYAILFILDTLAMQIEDEIARYRDAALPAITVLPSGKGHTDYALNALQAATERAVGADILK